MTIEEVLHDAMRAAQAIFKGKSWNIGYYDPNIPSGEKKDLYNEISVHARNHIFEILHRELFSEEPNKQKNDQEIYHYLHKNKRKFLVSNCLLLSIYALYHLKKKHKNTLRHLFYHSILNYTDDQTPLTLQILSLQYPYDHAFVIVYPPGKDIPGLGETSSPDTFPKDSWICDPWAGIVCPADFYNYRWKMKMTEWSFRGKTIYINDYDINDHDNNALDFNHSPLGRYTYTAIERGNRTTISSIEIPPQGKSIIDGKPQTRKCTIF
ncbi:hypothetical protein [Xenorhabdus sp. IM139775]|uniref:hypothetical protein n=1 Tax=Xenorhabdus sp. IM139775 TaxID=3025876 RepID=UPI00235925D0|nr:hypothetical protein [Xenorhabdus sp. IM139775]MDC9592672.1 hypothetical protein [Xenorhabdus sp. IM139775]